jgi:hypothetical protein
LLSGKIYNVSARVAGPELDGIVHVGSEAVASWSPALQEMHTDLVIGDQWPAGSGASWDTTVRITEGIL